MADPKAPGDSAEQREAERWLVQALEEKLQVRLTPNCELTLNGGARVKLDAYCDSPRIFCEVWAHHGRLRGSQPDKVMTDALKLVYVSQCLGGGRKMLVFADSEAAKSFTNGKGWMAACLKANQVEVTVLPLDATLQQKVKQAQQRQSR